MDVSRFDAYLHSMCARIFTYPTRLGTACMACSSAFKSSRAVFRSSVWRNVILSVVSYPSSELVSACWDGVSRSYDFLMTHCWHFFLAPPDQLEQMEHCHRCFWLRRPSVFGNPAVVVPPRTHHDGQNMCLLRNCYQIASLE